MLVIMTIWGIHRDRVNNISKYYQLCSRTDRPVFLMKSNDSQLFAQTFHSKIPRNFSESEYLRIGRSGYMKGPYFLPCLGNILNIVPFSMPGINSQIHQSKVS